MKLSNLILYLIVIIFLVSCKTTYHKIDLDSQLYMMPSPYGSKLIGLIYFKKSDYLFSFGSQSQLDSIMKDVKKMGGNKVVPMELIVSKDSIKNQIMKKTNYIKIKGFVVNEIGH